MKRFSFAGVAAGLAAAAFAAAAGATPITMADAQHIGAAALQPPPVCCSPVGPPVAGEPATVNMAYFGGHVQVSPKIYSYENGDKCAWVGDTFGLTSPTIVPGGVNDSTGADGKQYAVQSLWSNDSAGGAGWCAGANDDLPVTG